MSYESVLGPEAVLEGRQTKYDFKHRRRIIETAACEYVYDLRPLLNKRLNSY